MDMTRSMSAESLEVELQSGGNLHSTVLLQAMRYSSFIVALTLNMKQPAIMEQSLDALSVLRTTLMYHDSLFQLALK